MSSGKVTVALVVCLLVAATAAQAVPLNLVPMPPDIASGVTLISYDASTDQLTVDGHADSYLVPPDALISPPDGGVFDLDAMIDAAGNLYGGTLIIKGATTGGSGSGTFEDLLTAHLDIFGFTASPPTFEFIGTVTGGALSPDFGGVGGKVGIVVSSQDGSFPGNFEQNWESDLGGAAADTFAYVPEPASMSLLLGATLTLALRKRRSRK